MKQIEKGYNPQFDIDLEFGCDYEDKLKEIFLSKEKIEVKSDRMTHITGNAVIEFESRGKPSGISVTTADYWFYWVAEKETGILIPTTRLKKIVEGAKVVNGGDDLTSKLYLIPIEKLLK